MSLNNDQHNFQVQPEKIEQLDEEVGPSPLSSFGWNGWVKLVFICKMYFIFHIYLDINRLITF
jgi:hypothetical protein